CYDRDLDWCCAPARARAARRRARERRPTSATRGVVRRTSLLGLQILFRFVLRSFGLGRGSAGRGVSDVPNRLPEAHAFLCHVHLELGEAIAIQVVGHVQRGDELALILEAERRLIESQSARKQRGDFRVEPWT